MRMTATIDSTGAVELDTAGQITRENHSTVADARRAVMDTAKTLAEQTSQDMQLHIEDPAGSRTFLVGADGMSRQESVAPAGITHGRVLLTGDLPGSVQLYGTGGVDRGGHSHQGVSLAVGVGLSAGDVLAVGEGLAVGVGPETRRA